MISILHLTTVHPRRDTRIFYRECMSLKDAGYKIWLLVADGLGDEEENGVHIIDIGKPKSRWSGFWKRNQQIIEKVRELKPSLVHFHDPELIIVGNQIRKKFKIPVIFDIHENIALQLLNKNYIPKYLKPLASRTYALFEKLSINKFHLILAETSYLKDYRGKGKSSTTVLNMPNLLDFSEFVNLSRTGNGLFYIGGVTPDRGVHLIIDALKELHSRGVDFHMHFIGRHSGFSIEELALDGVAEKVTFYGRMDSKKGFALADDCVVGLSILKPIKNYVESYSTKIFEYMAIGLPVITSNFPLYKNVIEKYNAGYCVDPFNSQEIADKIELLLNNPDTVTQMGNNGIRAVNEYHNWSGEKEKLLARYQALINEDHSI